MAGKKATTKLTFAVTVPQPEGLKITDVRALVVDGIKSVWPEVGGTPEVKCHLTNKETHYGKC